MALETELAFLEARRDELLRKYGPKFIVIHGEEVGAACETISEALERAAEIYGTANVLIRQAEQETGTVFVPAYALGVPSADHPH